jgi:hypothetical protein
MVRRASWSSWSLVAVAALAACSAASPLRPEPVAASGDSLPVVRHRGEVMVAAGTGARCELCGDASALAVLLRELGTLPPPELGPTAGDDVLVVLPADGAKAASLSLATEEGVDVLTFVAAASGRTGRFAQWVVLPRRNCQLAVVWRHASPALGEQTLRVFARDHGR